MSSVKSLLSLGLLSLLDSHLALALPTSYTSLTPRVTVMIPSDPNFDPNHPIINPANKPNITEYKREKTSISITLICPSPLAPQFGSTSGAWKVIEHLKTLEYGPALPTVIMGDGCRRMGCQEGLGVFWCVKDASQLVPFSLPDFVFFHSSLFLSS